MHSRSRAILSGIVVAVLAAPQAFAGAFQINERSAAAQGASFAGSVSSARDVTFAGFNPAALSTVDGGAGSLEIGGNISLISPVADGTVQTGPAAGATIDADKIGFVPALAAGYRLTDDLIVGLSTYAPFGLKTEYAASSPVAGDGIDSGLLSISLSPMVAYEVANNFTIGASFNVLYVDAKLTSAAVALEGDDFGFGFSVGTLFEPIDGTQIGAAYHHGYDLSVDSDGFGGLPGKVEASLPNWVQIGITQEVSDELRVMAEGRWINWSRFDSIDITTPGAGGFAFVQDVQNYEDAFFFAAGAEYDITDRLTLRGGLAYDETPTTDAFRTVRVPDEDRLWLSFGASYDITDRMSVDAAYSYLHALRDADVTLRNGPLAGSQVEYNGGVHIFSVGGSIRF
ncbi:MAG: outer membrane protein transport protein [Paracoccaceae bacterium]|nr:outer membrane protein transport protein [Paracoccaceae bacterium]